MKRICWEIIVSITREDEVLFHKVCERVIGNEYNKKGIGTLSEKTVHAVLKHYLVPIEQCHEIKCNGYVADIMHDGEIIEIQTAQFNLLRKKLDVFLPKYDVTIVYPIPAIKWLIWIQEDTGEITKKRKSTRNGRPGLIFPELYKIKQYLDHPNLHLRIILMEVEEYRLLNGWSKDKKKGSTRFDRIPVALHDDIMISTIDDYEYLLPDNLPEIFTSSDFGKASGITLKQGQTALNVLCYLGIIKKIGKSGRWIQYAKTQKRRQQYE